MRSWMKLMAVAALVLVGDALTVRGILVEDIMSKTRRQLHSVTSFGRVRGNRITYPISKASREPF
jgi:hypothetical protein